MVIDNNNKKIPHLRFCAQNCQSLNISTKNPITQKKVLALTKDRYDIILLSDIKLNSQIQTHAIHDLIKMFKFAGYDLIYNSPTASRGVGILISTKSNYKITDTRKDDTGNLLIINVEINDIKFTVGSVYGPNDNDLSFFADLERFLNEIKCNYVILGGGTGTSLRIRGRLARTWT
jgi:exonuclease III